MIEEQIDSQLNNPNKDLKQFPTSNTKSQKFNDIIFYLIFLIIIIFISGFFIFLKMSWNTQDSSNNIVTKPSLDTQVNLEGKITASKENIIKDPIISDIIDDKNHYRHNYEYDKDDQILFFEGNNKDRIYPPKKIQDAISKYGFEDDSNGITTQISYDMPVNPQNKNMIFISTASLDAKDFNTVSNCRDKIYSYDIKKAELTLLYEEFSANCVSSRLVGTQGSKLIMWQTGYDNSPGPCYSPWIDGRFKYLELSDINSGLHEFIVPEEKVKEEINIEKECQQQINQL